MLSEIYRYILRYLIWIGLPFLIARKLERLILKNLPPELKKTLERNSDIKTTQEEPENVLKVRGGAEPVLAAWLAKIIVVDFALKAALAGGVWATIWSETADNAALQLAKYAAAIVGAPGNKFKALKKIKALKTDYNQEVMQIFIDKELSNQDKLELLKIRIEQALRNLKGKKRIKFLYFLIACIIFLYGGNFVAFGWLLERLRALIGTKDSESLRQALIEIYQQFNAPIPRELTENLPDDILESIIE